MLESCDGGLVFVVILGVRVEDCGSYHQDDCFFARVLVTGKSADGDPRIGVGRQYKGLLPA